MLPCIGKEEAESQELRLEVCQMWLLYRNFSDLCVLFIHLSFLIDK